MGLAERGLDAPDVEQAIGEAMVDEGRAEWLVAGVLSGGTPFEAI